MRKKFETGFSVYLSTGKEKNEKIIEKAVKSGAKYVFTSLNISEEKVDKQSELEKIIRRSEEHTSELQSLRRISYAVFCLKKAARGREKARGGKEGRSQEESRR